MACRVLRAEVVRFGEPETGVWCDECLLPSALTVVLVLIVGMREIGRLTVTVCLDCGREWRH